MDFKFYGTRIIVASISGFFATILVSEAAQNWYWYWNWSWNWRPWSIPVPRVNHQFDTRTKNLVFYRLHAISLKLWMEGMDFSYAGSWSLMNLFEIRLTMVFHGNIKIMVAMPGWSLHLG